MGKRIVRWLGTALLICGTLNLQLAFADAPAPSTGNPSKAQLTVLTSPNTEVKTIDELRLRLLEKTEGIVWYVWGYEIPAGQKLVVRFVSGYPTQNPPSKGGVTFEITGPLGKSFKNRISLVKSLTPISDGAANVEQYWFEASSEKQSQGSDSLGATIWKLEEGGQGWYVSPGEPLTGHPAIQIFSAQRTRKDKGVTFQCAIEASVAPADPGSEPGKIIQK